MCIYWENNSRWASWGFSLWFLGVISIPTLLLSLFIPPLCSPLLQLHDHTEPLLPPLHGAGLDLLCVHDCEEHRAGEGAAPQGDSQSHGGRQRGHLVHVFHRQLRHDDREHSAAHLHRHGEWDSDGWGGHGDGRGSSFMACNGALLWRILKRDFFFYVSCSATGCTGSVSVYVNTSI